MAGFVAFLKLALKVILFNEEQQIKNVGKNLKFKFLINFNLKVFVCLTHFQCN